VPDLALGKEGLCRVPETGHSTKKINKKLKKPLPSARDRALGKKKINKKKKKTLAECQSQGTRKKK